jgi:hypothetical protein
MHSFHNFTAPLWNIFIGNLLLLCCSLFYLIWWVVSYRPNSTGISATSGLYLTAAFITGIAAIALISYGISSLASDSNGLPVKVILISVGILFLVLLPVTTIIFHRTVTSELLLIHVWTALQLSAVVVLNGTGRFNTVRTIPLAILIGLATVVGLICYVLYYQLDEWASYWNGMIPLIADGLVALVFMVVLVL